MLTDSEILRYSRHFLLDDIGVTGQDKLKQAKILIIGVGGLGSPAAIYLAGAGVGNLILSDDDDLEISNLQRQIGYSTKDIGKAKIDLMKQRLTEINPEIKTRLIKNKMSEEQLSMELLLADCVLDCTDNMTSRQLINRACVKRKTPVIVGAAIRFEGQLMFFNHTNNESACYHCLFPNNEEQALNCSNAGIIGPVVGTIGALQALEAIKYITGLPSGAENKLKLFDGKTLDWQTFAINKNTLCNVCGNKEENK
ncbi:MAG TPA: HesA/MoeB/ThiF family protein [Psychromonas hadalis]|nr:HesA/MoeB/ThiF family protein [Psychromonas hadalis]